jgi:hypothetical protein
MNARDALELVTFVVTIVALPFAVWVYTALANPTPEQNERMRVIFDMLISLFERAYLVAYKTQMSPAETTALELVGRLHARVVPA